MSTTAAPTAEQKALAAEPAPLATQPTPGQKAEAAAEPAPWTCTQCTFIALNPPSCEMCGQPNPTFVLPADPPSAAGGGGGGSSAVSGPILLPSGGWICGVCTLENPDPSQKACSACTAPAPGAFATSDKWACENCTYMNEGLGPACSVCSHPAPFTVTGEGLEGSSGASGLPGAPPRLRLGRGSAAPMRFEGETPLPEPLQPVEGSDPVLSLSRKAILGPALSSCLVFTRQLGHSSLRASRYTASSELRALYKTALADEAASVEPGVATGNEAGTHPSSRGGDVTAAVSALQKEVSFFQSNDSNSEWSSSLLLRADDTNLLALRAAITGAEHTPYANGFFTFDIACPAGYPASPPHMLITSRGSGGVRFNPNLYSCGKVCLSLLGTWSGPGWESGVSNIYQLLQSVQGLVMNKFPLENEPSQGAPPPGSSTEAFSSHFLRCSVYNLEVRLGTLMCAMLQPLRSRPANFDSAVATHFSLKRWEVAAQAVQWCEEAVLFAFFAVEVQRNPLARANAEGKRLCKEFLASGTCQKGVACMYSHVRADSQVDYRKYAPLLAITYGVFENPGLNPLYLASEPAGWQGPKSLEELALQLAKLRRLRRSLFYPAAAGTASSAAETPAAADAAAAGGGSTSSSSSSSSAAAPTVSEDVRHQQAFWRACSYLRVCEELFAELHKLGPAEGVSGDGGEPVSEAARGRGEQADAALQGFARLVASAAGRKEDIGGGWAGAEGGGGGVGGSEDEGGGYGGGEGYAGQEEDDNS